MSGGLGLVFRASVRHGWRGLLAIALLVGLAGGAVLTGWEAVRRTETAFDRMRAATDSWDVLVNPDDGTDSALTEDDVAALPSVTDIGRVDGVLMGPGHVDAITDLDQGPLTLATDGTIGYEFSRYRLLEGRMPDPDAVHDVLVTPAAADSLNVDVGDTFRQKLISGEDFESVAGVTVVDDLVAAYNAADFGQPVDLSVAGIGVPIDELVVDESFGDGSVVVTPGFWAHYDEPSAGFLGYAVRLRDGASVDEFRRGVEALVPDETVAFQTADAIADQVGRAVDPEASAVRVFTAIAALVALVIVAQAVSRRLQLDATADAPLRALGMTRAQRVVLALARMVLAAAVGALLAVVIAVLASPIAPVGIIRPAEPDPGVRIDPWVLGLGVLGIVLGTTAVTVWPAVRVARASRRERTRAGFVSSLLVGWGVRPPAVMGARFALEPGPASVPTGSTLVGAATSVVLVAATITFAGCLDHFVDTPDLYGTTWGSLVTVDAAADGIDADYGPVLAGFEDDPRVEAFSMVVPGQVTLEGRSVPAFALDQSVRPLHPTVLDGRPPAADDEVVLGSATLDELDVEVGDAVAVASVDGALGRLTVVGRGVFPAIAAYSGSDKTTLGEGAALTSGGLQRWSPGYEPAGIATRLADGSDVAGVVSDISIPATQYTDVEAAGRPSDVASLERVRSTPLFLSGLLAALIALTVAHALGAAVRARRRELAVLRTFGFTRRQVVGAVATQASLIAVVGLLVGVPVGIALGRLAWSVLVDRLGAIVDLVTPVLALAVAALAVLAVANLVGLVPGLRAARAHPADTLRTE